jgi:hypothetical protein
VGCTGRWTLTAGRGTFSPFIAPKVNLTGTGVAARPVAGDSGLSTFDGITLIPITGKQVLGACVAASLRCTPAFHYGGAV